MKVPERLMRLIEPVVAGLGYELVGIEHDSSQRVLRVYIDSETGIGLDDCSKVSHQVSGLLDVEDPIQGNYRLEISSPGMDRPLFTPAHFKRFQGSLVRLQLLRMVEGRRRFKARLQEVSDDRILLQDDTGTVEVPFELIDRARLVPEFESKNSKG